MAALMETKSVFPGKTHELHVSLDGLALTHKGRVLADRSYQAVRWDEVAGAELDAKGTRLLVVFSSERPTWAVEGMNRAEAAWAHMLINQAAERARLYRQAVFTQPLGGEELREALRELAEAPAPQPAVLADLILTQAILAGATDVHFQAESEATLVRYRVDGCLREVTSLPPDLAERVIARLKVTGGMQTYQRNVAQTGRSTMVVEGRRVDLRLTVLPTTHGEKLTVRLFDPQQAILDLAALGMGASVLAAYQELLSQPQGTFLLTGPAGSGKTTTMYASLAHLHAQYPDLSFATVEEPVELDLPGVGQTEVNRAVGLDFAEGLRTALRQDPQVLMVGEIRDQETADIAMQAGLTGHRVFSTVHAPSAAGVFTRLTQLGVEPYLVASSVTAVMAQRLVRRVCEACAESYAPSPTELAGAGMSREQISGNLRRGRGCEQCGGTGYHGRTGLFALLPVTAALREALLACRPLSHLEELAAQESVGSLWETGWAKVGDGVTTLEEVQRVLGRPSA